jgi:hypothetical protein
MSDMHLRTTQQMEASQRQELARQLDAEEELEAQNIVLRTRHAAEEFLRQRMVAGTPHDPIVAAARQHGEEVVASTIGRNVLHRYAESVYLDAQNAIPEATAQLWKPEMAKTDELANALLRELHSKTPKEALQRYETLIKQRTVQAFCGLQATAINPIRTAGLAIQAKLHQVMEADGEHLLIGGGPVPGFFGQRTLRIFESGIQEKTALLRILKGRAGPLTMETLPKIKDAYERRRFQTRHAVYMSTGAYDLIGEEVADQGIFMAPFDADEGIVLPQLIEATQRSQQYNPVTQPERRFAEETMASAVIEDPLSGDMLGMAVITIPALNPDLKEFQKKFRKKSRVDEYSKGRVGMIKLIIGNVKIATTIAMYLCVALLQQMQRKLTKVWSYFLNDLQGEILSGEDVSALPMPSLPLSNNASGNFLAYNGFQTEAIYSGGLEEGDYTIFEDVHAPDFQVHHQRLRITHFWQLVLASYEKMVKKVETNTFRLLHQNNVPPTALSEPVRSYLHACGVPSGGWATPERTSFPALPPT